MNHTYRYVFFSFAEMYVEARISNEPRLDISPHFKFLFSNERFDFCYNFLIIDQKD